MLRVHCYPIFLLLVGALGCSEETENVIRKRGPAVERLDGAFERIKCPPSSVNEPFPSSQVELARIEAVRAKVDGAAAFRSAHVLRLAALCRGSDEEVRREAAQAYRLLRSQVARSVLGASRARTMGDRKLERTYLSELIELVRLILPEDAAIAERRIRQLDIAARPR